MEKLGCSISLNKRFTRMSARHLLQNFSPVARMCATIKFHWEICDRVPICENRSQDEPLGILCRVNRSNSIPIYVIIISGTACAPPPVDFPLVTLLNESCLPQQQQPKWLEHVSQPLLLIGQQGHVNYVYVRALPLCEQNFFIYHINNKSAWSIQTNFTPPRLQIRLYYAPLSRCYR